MRVLEQTIGAPPAATADDRARLKREVRWNGKRILEGDFLEDAVYREGWKNCEIGVFHEEAAGANGNTLELLAPARQGRRGRMTIGGILVCSEDLPEMERAGERWWARVVAPADTWLDWHTGRRNRPNTECPYWQELERAVRQTIYMAMAQYGTAIEVSRATWEQAKLGGVELPEATEALVRWEAPGHQTMRRAAQGDRERLQAQHENFIMAAGSARPDLHVLSDAATRADVRLWQPNARLRGFDWYDALERLIVHSRPRGMLKA